MKPSHKRELILLIAVLLLFSVLFIIAMLNLQRKIPVFGLGLPYFVEDGLIILLSMLSILKIFWTIIKH